MTINQNFPIVEDAWSPSYGANGGTMPLNQWVDLNDRTRYAASIKRGKQYELDQVQAGELSITLNNSDGVLDPMNGAGPFAGNIRPFQPFRHRVQWSPTTNRLPQTVATGGEGYGAGTIPAGFGITSATDVTGGSIVVAGTGVAFEEANVFQFAVPGASAGGSAIALFDAGAVFPGKSHSFSFYVRNITPALSVTVTASIGWYGAADVPTSFAVSANAVLVGSATSTWTRVTVSGVAPANAYGARLAISLPATWQNNTVAVQVDAQQFELGAAATTWVYPGLWYGQFAGFIERWTPQYQDAGTRAEAVVTAVDAFALFSQRTLADALTEEFNVLNPRFVYRLNDPAGSLAAADATGSFTTAPLAGTTFAFGTDITSTDPGNAWVGPDTVLTMTAPNYVSLDSAGIKGPANPNLWTRMVAFRIPPSLGGTEYVWSAFDQHTSGGSPNGSNIQLSLTTLGVSWAVGGATTYAGNTQTFGGNKPVSDGDWHLAIFGMDANGGTMLASLDGNTSAAFQSSAFSPGTGSSKVPTGLTCDSVGAQVVKSLSTAAQNGFTGDIALVAEFPTLLTAAQVSSLYSAWRTAGTGDSTDARYSRILRYLGYTGPTLIDNGNTRSMGPITFSGTDGLSALQAVVDTESGAHWVQGNGVIRFRSRASRYNALTPTLTFGEGPGEIPYEDIQLDFDSTHLANIVQVTQTSTGQVFTAQDDTSIANYFQRLLTRNVDTTNPLECQDAANYLVSRYKDAIMRVSSLKVNVGASPASWASVLPLELGMRIRVMRRPLGCPPIQVDCFIEQLQWDYDNLGNATLTMMCSPVDPVAYGMLTGWRTTLGAACAVGATSITINAPTFDNQNPLAAQLYAGSQLVVGQGGAVPETMTVKSVSATSPGWSTATVTFTAATAHSHTNGFLVTELLPSTANGNAATWDLAAVSDSVRFAY